MISQEIVLTQEQKIHLGITEISRRVKNQLNREFPKCVFSVTKESYSMGCALHVSLMKADRRIKRRFEELTDHEIFIITSRSRYTKEELKQNQEAKHHQLNQYSLIGPFEAEYWCNGVFLTEDGHNFLKHVLEIIEQYNYDNSDPQTDYYDVNFSLNLNLGKWNQPFTDGYD